MVIYNTLNPVVYENSSATRLLTVMEAQSQPHGVVLKKGQSLFDGALQHCGDADQAQAIALLNSLPLDHVATDDEDILIPEPEVRSVRVLTEHACEPCTGDLESAAGYTFYGLGYRRLGRMRIVRQRMTSQSILQSLTQHYRLVLLGQAQNARPNELHLL